MPDRKALRQIICPYCGYRMPLWCTDEAASKGIFAVCKDKNCKKLFEIDPKKFGK